jgi:hypothetical protein
VLYILRIAVYGEAFRELKLLGNGCLRYALGGRGLLRRQTLLFPVCIPPPLLDCRPCEFPLPHPTAESDRPSFYMSAQSQSTLPRVSHAIGAVFLLSARIANNSCLSPRIGRLDKQDTSTAGIDTAGLGLSFTHRSRRRFTF